MCNLNTVLDCNASAMEKYGSRTVPICPVTAVHNKNKTPTMLLKGSELIFKRFVSLFVIQFIVTHNVISVTSYRDGTYL